MTPAQKLLAALRARGVTLRADGDRLIAGPASALTAEHRVLLDRHAEELVALLRGPRKRDEVVIELESDAILRGEAEAEDRLWCAVMAPPPPEVVFRMRRGLIELRNLWPDEVRSLEAQGRITPDDIRQWSRSRRRGGHLW